MADNRTFVQGRTILDYGSSGPTGVDQQHVLAGRPQAIMKRVAEFSHGYEKAQNSGDVTSTWVPDPQFRAQNTGPWRWTANKQGRREIAGDLGLPNVKKNGRSKGVRKNPYAN